MLDLVQLRSFVSVAQAGSFTIAARNWVSGNPRSVSTCNDWKRSCVTAFWPGYAQRPADARGRGIASARPAIAVS